MNKFIIQFVNACLTNKIFVIKYSVIDVLWALLKDKIAIVKIRIQQCSRKIFKIVYLNMLV